MHTQRGTLLHSSSRPVRTTSLHSTQSARSSQTTYFTSFVPDEDLRGRYIVRCRYLLCESSSTQLSYIYEAVAMSLYNILIFLLLIYSYSIFYNNIMCHHLTASKQKGMDGEHSELLMLSCSQSSIDLGTTGLEVVLQIPSAIRLFRNQVTLLRSPQTDHHSMHARQTLLGK